MCGLELCRRDHANLTVQAPVVEPGDVLEGLELDVVQAAPRSFLVNQFGLVQAVEGFGERVVVRVAAGADGSHRARAGEPLRVADGEILRTAVGMADESVE